MEYVVTLIPFASALILAFLTYDLYRRYQRHQGTHKHLLFWGIGLGMFALASFCDGVLHLTWNEMAFYGWYLFGAMLNAAWIGEGTVFLLVRKQWVVFTAVVLAIVSILSLVMLASSPLNASAYQTGVPIATQYRNIMSLTPFVLSLTIILNTYGTLTIVGGALYSGYLFYRKRILPNRVLGNILIAAGTLAIAGAGVLIRLGLGQFQSFAQLAFAFLMYAGFVLASQPAAVQSNETAPASPSVAAK
jgi:hypothetical protein